MSHPHPPPTGFGPPGGGGYNPPPGGYGPPGGAPPGAPPGGYGGPPPGGYGGPPGGYGGPPPGGFGGPPGGFGAPAGQGWGAPGGPPPGGFGHPGGPPPQKSNAPLIIGIIVGIVLLCGVGSAVAIFATSRFGDIADNRSTRDDGDRSSKSKKSSSADDDDEETPAEAPDKKIRARDGNSEVTVPLAWRELSNLNDEAKLEAGNPVLEEYLIVLTEAKTDFAIPITLDRYAEINLGTLRRVVKGATVSSPTKLTIDGRNAVQYEVRGTVDLLNIVYLVTYVDGRKHVHQVVSWTLGSKYASNKSRFESVAKTFREL
jgi:hypothetical protein